MVKLNQNQILIAVAVLAVAITGVLILGGSNPQVAKVLSYFKLNTGMSAETIAKNSVNHLNTNVLQAGNTAELVSYSEESGVIKMKITIAGKAYDSYATKDGKLLFPEAIAIAVTASPTTPTAQNTTQVTPATVTKVAKTMLDAYVVSGCPFGIQVQRALADAIKTVPAIAEYVKVRYIGAISGNTITAMHGVEEADENLRQICIREEQPAKYWNYVSCYIKKAAGTSAGGMPYGDTKTCQKETGVDSVKLNACVGDVNRGVKFAKEDFDLNAKLNVQGSPTLILNDQRISEDAFGGRSADAMRNIVCSSSITAPAFCATKLNTTPATTSFSVSYAAPAGATTAAANTNCAPAVQ